MKDITVYSVLSEPDVCGCKVIRMALHPEIPTLPSTHMRSPLVAHRVVYDNAEDPFGWRYSCMGTGAAWAGGRVGWPANWTEDIGSEGAALEWLLEEVL